MKSPCYQLNLHVISEIFLLSVKSSCYQWNLPVISEIFLAGDGGYRDSDGDIWLTGRVDDVMNISGHRIGTAEVEGVLVDHPAVAESAVVPKPHDIKGEGKLCQIL